MAVDALTEERPTTCPRCGAPSREIRLAGRAWRALLCDACLDLEQREEAEAAVAALAPQAQWQREQRLLQLEVPALYRDVSLETFKHHGSPEEVRTQARILQLARRYIGTWPDVPMIVVLQGPPGTGKGHVLWSIAKAIAHLHGERARIVKLSDAIRDLRAAWAPGSGASEMARLAHYRAPRFLGIDEVSRHAFYAQPQQHLYDLVDYREEQLRPTILTTNETGAALAELLGPALVSRCAGWGSIWQFGTHDFRLHRGKSRNESAV